MIGSSPLLLIAALLLLATIGAIVWTITRRLYVHLTWRGVLVSTLPGELMAVSFYAIAIHNMYVSLDGWPQVIGEEGFSPVLLWHSRLDMCYFVAMALTFVLLWPAALLVVSIVPRWERYIAHLGLFGASFALCFFLMMIGPSMFVQWWLD